MAPKFKEGRYRGRVVSQALTESGGTPCAELTFLISHSLGAGGMAVLQNQLRRTVRLWFTKDGLTVTMRALQQLGDVPERPGQLDPYALDAVLYTGREVELECLHREYEGEPREDWNIARPAPTRLSDERIAELDEMFSEQMKSGPQPGAAAEPGEHIDEPTDTPVPY